MVAGEDLLGKTYQYAKVGADGTVTGVTAYETGVIGVIQDGVPNGEPVTVMVHGVSFVKLATTATPGTAVAEGASFIYLVGGETGAIGSVLVK